VRGACDRAQNREELRARLLGENGICRRGGHNAWTEKVRSSDPGTLHDWLDQKIGSEDDAAAILLRVISEVTRAPVTGRAGHE